MVSGTKMAKKWEKTESLRTRKRGKERKS